MGKVHESAAVDSKSSINISEAISSEKKRKTHDERANGEFHSKDKSAKKRKGERKSAIVELDTSHNLSLNGSSIENVLNGVKALEATRTIEQTGPVDDEASRASPFPYQNGKYSVLEAETRKPETGGSVNKEMRKIEKHSSDKPSKTQQEKGALGGLQDRPDPDTIRENIYESKEALQNVLDIGSPLLEIRKNDSKEIRKAKRKQIKRLQKIGKSNTSNVSTNSPSDKHELEGPLNISQAAFIEGVKLQVFTESAELTALSQQDIDTYNTSNVITVSGVPPKKQLRPIFKFSYLPSDTRKNPSPFAKFEQPTAIQAAAWPYLLSGRDVIGVAETGSGKTLAFGIPCVRRLSSSISKAGKTGPPHAVVVSPTRELALQINEQFLTLARPYGLNSVCVYGGVPKDPQRVALKTAHIIIATPGRLNDLVSEGSAKLSNVEYLVLDEADRMLDKGFEEDIRKIVSACGRLEIRQTLMFTATWPASVRSLAGTFMRSPVKIQIGDSIGDEARANTRIEQRVEVLDTNPRAKEMRLVQLVRQFQKAGSARDRILIFALYKKEAVRVENFLRDKGLSVAAIHGDLSQDRRTAALEGFKRGTTPILVATDVAARGLDIPAVKAVINVTFPLTVEDYVHRIGRTGRAGAHGIAVTLFTEHDKQLSGALINVLRAAKQPVPEELLKFGTTVKKKEHAAYGAFYKEPVDGVKKATKIKFDD